MENLSLKQLQDMGIHQFMSDKEIQKQIDEAKSKQALQLEFGNTEKKLGKTLHKDVIDKVLKEGGATYIIKEVDGKKKKVRFSCLTPDMLQMHDNKSNYVEDGVELDLPPLYRYHVRTALGNVITVKAVTYQQAQEVIDELLGVGMYKVSGSRL